MNISVKGIKVKEIQALEEYATKKAAKFYKTAKNISKVDILMETKVARAGVDKDFEVTIHVHIPGKTETVKEITGDMYASIDLGVSRMMEVLRRQKEKAVSKRFKAIKQLKDRLFGLFRR